jgi:superfamily I DNA/RNA helicase
MTARGRTRFLRVCYRNTKEIVEFAWRFLQAANLGELNDDQLDDPTLVVPPESTSRRGKKPEVLQCADVDAEADAITERILTAHASGIPWSQIAVLYGSQKPWVFAIMRRLGALDIPFLWVSKNGLTKRQVIEAGDVVRIATLQGLKGLEFSRVLVCGVNDIYDPGGTDDDTRRKVVYVAMTRAMDELVMTVSGTGPIGQAIQSAQA